MSLVLADVIQTDRPLDNISLDKLGAIWAAGIPNAEHRGTIHFEDPSVHNPSTALRITPNKDESQYLGEKFRIETVFEDAGEVASGATSVAYDTERKKAFLAWRSVAASDCLRPLIKYTRTMDSGYHLAGMLSRTLFMLCVCCTLW